MTAFSQVDPAMAAVRAAEANRRAVEVFLSAHPELPVARPPVATPDGAAVITVADVDGLADWLAARGGTIRRSTPDGGVQMWQLYTSLPRTDGSRTAVRVVTAAAEDVPVPDEVLSAVVSGGPRVTARGALTPDRLAEIRARVEAATPGPWAVDSSGVFGADTVVAAVSGYERVVGSLAFGAGEDAEADRAFTLHASEDMRALLAEVERQADELAARPSRADVLRQVAAEMVEYCPDRGTGSTSRMTCACPVAHDLLGQADRAEAVEAESESQLRARTLREGAAEVRARCLSVPGRCGCHTAAALLEAMAMAMADGTVLLHCETPARRGDTITERGHQMTCTPHALAWAHRLDAHGLSAFLLDLATAALGYYQHDDPGHVLEQVERVFAEHEAGDGRDACGHDGLDRCENCGRCPCAVCPTCRVCTCECEGGEGR